MRMRAQYYEPEDTVPDGLMQPGQWGSARQSYFQADFVSCPTRRLTAVKLGCAV